MHYTWGLWLTTILAGDTGRAEPGGLCVVWFVRFVDGIYFYRSRKGDRAFLDREGSLVEFPVEIFERLDKKEKKDGKETEGRDKPDSGKEPRAVRRKRGENGA